jgi:hypothetical protein
MKIFRQEASMEASSSVTLASLISLSNCTPPIIQVLVYVLGPINYSYLEMNIDLKDAPNGQKTKERGTKTN